MKHPRMNPVHAGAHMVQPANLPGSAQAASNTFWRLSIAAACALTLTACATAPGLNGSAPMDAARNAESTPFADLGPTAAKSPAGTFVTNAEAERPALKLNLPSQRPVQDSSMDVAGQPSDPLAPDTTVALGSPEAREDLWSRIRRGYAMPELASPLVQEHEQWYANRPDYVARMTERGSRYLYHIVDEVARRGMPTELALLPFIESAFNPQATSSARASGMWQFMPATGKYFELKQNMFRDDRRDVLSSTRAALDYLAKLHGMFGDWQLALAAYNWGEGNVARALERNRAAGRPTDYENLGMPAETRHYVPKLMAVKNIVMNPQQFGLTLKPLQNHPHFLSVPIQRDIDVAQAAQLAGLGVEEFKTLNPQHNKPVILSAGTPQVLLPYDNADRFVRNLAAHRGQLASWTAWVVPRTMKSADAAREAGTSEEVLRDLNRIPAKMLVKAGSTLLVPRQEHRHQDVSEAVADNAHMQLAPDVPPFKRVSFKARRGDTVASIAKHYRLSTTEVARLNPGASNGRFKPGLAIVLNVPTGSNAAPRPEEAPATVAVVRDRKGRIVQVAKAPAVSPAAERQAARNVDRALERAAAANTTHATRTAANAASRKADARTANVKTNVKTALKLDKPATKVAARNAPSAGKPASARASRPTAGTAGRLNSQRG